MPKPPLLTELQLAVMRVLWDQQRATVTDVAEALRPARGLAQTTIATVLTRLAKRGVVGHDTDSRQFVYYPRYSESEVQRSMVSDLTNRLFDGDAAALVSHLISATEFSRGDLTKVKALIAEHEGRKEKKR